MRKLLHVPEMCDLYSIHCFNFDFILIDIIVNLLQSAFDRSGHAYNIFGD